MSLFEDRARWRGQVNSPARFGAIVGLLAIVLASPANAQHPHSYRPGIDVLDYHISLALPDTGRAIYGQATLTIARAAGVDAVVLDLIGMKVDQAWVRGHSTRFTRDSHTVRVVLPPAARSDTLEVWVTYSGTPADGLIIRTDAAGRWTGFGDNWPTRARHWIPSVDDPSDKATITWVVTAPVGRRVVANGELISDVIPPMWSGSNPERRVGSVRRTTWRESRPIPTYLMVIAAAPLDYEYLAQSACGRTELGGCVRQTVYFESAPMLVSMGTIDSSGRVEQRRTIPEAFARADEIVTFFSNLIAPFPYEKLAHVQSSTRFGGMENASAIFYSDKSFREGTMRAGLIAHETAHQWFGNSVTPHRWADLWLSEGFASYFEQVWVQRFTGDSAFRAGMTRLREQIVASPEVATRPVIDTLERDYLELLNANSYQKGAWTLHMLRDLVGDSAFFRGVRSYYETHKHSTALTDDLRRAMEKESGQSLQWFFRQWLARPGFPEVTTSWTYDRSAQRVRLRVNQSGRFGLYRFRLAVNVRTATGAELTTIDVPAERSYSMTLPLRVASMPAAVDIDPDVTLLAVFNK